MIPVLLIRLKFYHENRPPFFIRLRNASDTLPVLITLIIVTLSDSTTLDCIFPVVFEK